MTTALCLLGAGLIVAGVAMVYVPAACVVAGVLLLAVGWSLDKARTGGES